MKVTTGEPEKNTTVFNAGGKEMLRISDEGFFVEGRKVSDGEEIYKSFKKWLEIQTA